jgi:hypothetical protein
VRAAEHVQYRGPGPHLLHPVRRRVRLREPPGHHGAHSPLPRSRVARPAQVEPHRLGAVQAPESPPDDRVRPARVATDGDVRERSRIVVRRRGGEGGALALFSVVAFSGGRLLALALFPGRLLAVLVAVRSESPPRLLPRVGATLRGVAERRADDVAQADAHARGLGAADRSAARGTRTRGARASGARRVAARQDDGGRGGGAPRGEGVRRGRRPGARFRSHR